MIIKKVLSRDRDGQKMVVIPKKSDVEIGDYVLITKVEPMNPNVQIKNTAGVQS